MLAIPPGALVTKPSTAQLRRWGSGKRTPSQRPQVASVRREADRIRPLCQQPEQAGNGYGGGHQKGSLGSIDQHDVGRQREDGGCDRRQCEDRND